MTDSTSPFIMVIDDNPTNLKLATDVLEAAGYRVIGAEDAERAEDALDQGLPDLILMDIGLPGMDGLTFTRKLRANERTRKIVIVALTAAAMIGDDVKALEAGCDGYLAKPIDTRRLPEQVARHVAAGRTP
jgi:CheY-like chemotaxis protein